MLPSLKDLSDTLLLENVKVFKKVEDQTIADLVLYLAEVDARKLYRDIGFLSLFSYCTSSITESGLGYSESSAYRRIQAARSLKDNPEIYELLRDGKLSLFAVAEISKVIKPYNKIELLELSQGKPKSEIQKIALKYQPAVMPLKREKIVARRVLIENKDPLFSISSALENGGEQAKEVTRFTFAAEVDQEFMDLLKEAKDLVGFVPSVEVIKRTLKEFINKRKGAVLQAKALEPEKEISSISSQTSVKRSDKKFPTVKSKPCPQSRYIARAVAREVKERDQYRGSFVSDSGKRCSETCGLQLDHIKPFALGGANNASNLRLLCHSHN